MDKRMRLKVLLIGCVLIAAGVATAEARLSNEETLIRFVQILQPTPEDDIFVEPILADQLGPGTHLRIRYRSQYLLPIEVVPMNGGASDLLSAVLPASEAGDELIDLTRSPAWRPGIQGVILKLYGLESAPPVIERLTMETKSRPFALLRHPFTPEGFSYYVMSELAGYRMGGVSVTLLLGILLLLVVTVLRCKGVPVRVVLIVILGALLLYQARFAVDLSRYTLALERSWWEEEHTLGHMGTVYAIADAVEEHLHQDDELLLCTDMISTPLRYLTYPLPVHLFHSLPGDAVPTHAVTVRTWNEALASFSCGNLRFSGSVLRLLPDGKAVVKILPAS